MERGWIKIHRKMTEWEWFSDHITLIVFLNLLLTVNFEDKKWQGHEVKRGQRIIGLSRLADEVGITLQQLRTSLVKLEKSGDISRKTTNKFTIITIVKFDSYQSVNVDSNKQTTNEQQSNNIQITNEQQQLKNERIKELKNERIIIPKDDAEFFKMKELSALATKYLGWNGNLTSGKAESLRPLTNIFKEDVERGFKAACDAGATSIKYVEKVASDNQQVDDDKPNAFLLAMEARNK